MALTVKAWAMAVPLIVIGAMAGRAVEDRRPTSWLTQVNDEPLIDQSRVALVLQVLLLLPVQVAIAAFPV